MIQDESQSPAPPFMQQGSAAMPPQQQQPQNSLGGITQGTPQQPTKINKQQLIAGLHHFSAINKHITPLLNNPAVGKSNMRPKLFDAAASLIGEKVLSVAEVMNDIKDFPDDPLEQKKWFEKLVGMNMQAEKKLISDYIAQGPGQEPEGPEWSMDNHKDHMTGLMGNYKR